MNAITIKKIGNSAGLILPKDVLNELGVGIGDALSVVKTPRGIELSASQPDFDEQMAAAREVMLRYRDALRELAK